jgi:hypothetical protein
MQRAQTVRKARVFRRLISEMRESELFYPPQALKFSRVDKADEKPAFRVARFEANNIMNRITIDFFRQFFAPEA